MNMIILENNKKETENYPEYRQVCGVKYVTDNSPWQVLVSPLLLIDRLLFSCASQGPQGREAVCAF